MHACMICGIGPPIQISFLHLWRESQLIKRIRNRLKERESRSDVLTIEARSIESTPSSLVTASKRTFSSGMTVDGNGVVGVEEQEGGK